MKTLRVRSFTRLRNVVCAVPAAALMLGVSHAASIGFNFQTDYCGASGTYRNNVTAAAFGIPVTGWENLTPMMTGLGGASPCDQAAYTLTEVIDTSTSTGGLNPLPNGSVTVNWNAPTANWSYWGGYDRGAPYYEFAGSTALPGDGEVYAGFLRDGINFGPPNGTPDNGLHAPPYSVDITGLSSVFTNTPFVIQLVASSDSMYRLTNAFIIDVAGSTTQSVMYANPYLPRDRNLASWILGFGGGLRTVSGNLNTDHVRLIGNFPQHSASADADRSNSTNNASCLAGFIITDKPVVSMSPRSVAAVPHDTVLLRAIAAGVPPLSYQWRNGGTPIGGATAASFGITNISIGGNYDLVVTNLYGAATSKVSAVTIDRISITPGPGPGSNTISWAATDAVLQSSDSVDGPFTDIFPNPGSPYPAPFERQTKFYRYRSTTTVHFSNPYDM